MKRYKMTLTILSPVHIGSGQDIDPTEYVVKNGVFYRIDLVRFLSGMQPNLRAEFDRRVSDPNPFVIRDFIRNHVDPEKYACFKAEAGAFEQVYQESLSNPNRQLEVSLFTRTPGTWRAYIPGSSIKGAIRTAVINTLAQEKKESVRQKKQEAEAKAKERAEQIIKELKQAHKKYDEEKIYQQQLQKTYEKFGKTQLEPLCLKQYKFNPQTDPFRCIKVEDVYLPDNSSTFVGQLKLFHCIKKTYTNVQMFCEQTYSLLHGKTVTAEGILTIDDVLLQKTKDSSNPAVSMAITHEMIIKSCQDFYWPKMEDEDENFYLEQEKGNPELFSNSEKLLLHCPYNDKKNEFLLRIGRFSHVECTTVDEFREPYNSRGWGKSRTLSGGTMPMGWVKVRLEPIS